MISYTTAAKLMQDPDFLGRARIACLKYANYISGEDTGVPAYNTRRRWSQSTFLNPDGSAAQIMSVLIMDEKVQTSGSGITDPDLQIAVETSVNRSL